MAWCVSFVQADGCESSAPCRICSADGYCWENPLPQGNFLLAVWGKDASQVWAVGYSGTILKWNGAVWEAQAGGTLNPLNAVWGASASNLWVVGAFGTILHKSDR